MNESKFWDIINTARKRSDVWDIRSVGGEVVEILIEHSKDEILAFDQIFDSLVDRAYLAVLWDAADLIACGCSDDGFIDFRGWLIAQGQHVYEAALENPDSLANVIPSHMRYATLDGLLLPVAWDTYYHKTQQHIPERRYHMPKLKGHRMEWEARKSHFPRLVFALGNCNPLYQNIKQFNPSGTYGIYEFADETDGGKWYVGGSTAVSLSTRFEQHRLKGRFSDGKKVVWSKITKPEFIDVAERVRMEQIISLESRSKSANICATVAYHPASDERIKRFYENRLWKQIKEWPSWLAPPDAYCDQIGLQRHYSRLS